VPGGNEAVHGRGHQPFDSDEFWGVDGTTFRSILAPTEAVVRGRWVNFVKRKSRLHSTRPGLFSVTHRAPHLPDAGRETITTYTHSFLCFSTQKIAIKTGTPVKIGRGQHGLAVEPQAVCGTKLEILHLPFRSRAEILKRPELRAAPGRKSARTATPILAGQVLRRSRHQRQARCGMGRPQLRFERADRHLRQAARGGRRSPASTNPAPSRLVFLDQDRSRPTMTVPNDKDAREAAELNTRLAIVAAVERHARRSRNLGYCSSITRLLPPNVALGLLRGSQ